MIWDLSALAGACLITAGLALWFLPAALIFAGVVLSAVGILGARHIGRKRLNVR